MSREIHVGVIAGQYTVGGKYITQFKNPLVLQPCQHWINEVKKRFKDERWYIIIHGNADGRSEVNKRCEKLKEI